MNKGTLDFLCISASSPTVFKRNIGLQLNAFFLSLSRFFNSSYSWPSSSGFFAGISSLVSLILTCSELFLTFFAAFSASFSSDSARSADTLRFLFCSKKM